ncbi:MAG: DUF5996 family protein, partial [Acidobacteriota bacterium]
YDDVREAEDSRKMILNFLESTYQAGAKRANWDIDDFNLRDLGAVKDK